MESPLAKIDFFGGGIPDPSTPAIAESVTRKPFRLAAPAEGWRLLANLFASITCIEERRKPPEVFLAGGGTGTRDLAASKTACCSLEARGANGRLAEEGLELLGALAKEGFRHFTRMMSAILCSMVAFRTSRFRCKRKASDSQKSPQGMGALSMLWREDSSDLPAETGRERPPGGADEGRLGTGDACWLLSPRHDGESTTSSLTPNVGLAGKPGEAAASADPRSPKSQLVIGQRSKNLVAK